MIRWLVLFVVITFPTLIVYPQVSRARSDRVIITRKQTVIVRSGKFARNFPDRKRATISYPVVTGLRNTTVLRKVRALLSINNVFDTDLKWYRESNWLDEFDYVVNYNDNYILDVTFTQSGMAAYPDSQSKTLSIDLRTGNVIKARDLFIQEKLPELARLVNERLQAEVVELIQAAREDPQLEDASSIIGALEELRFEVTDLDNLSVSKAGVTFLYDVGLPHIHRAFKPVGRYLFQYPDLESLVQAHSLVEPIMKQRHH